MSAPPVSITLEGSSGGPLDVERIERELAAMWKSASSRAGGAATYRACASTCVAVFPGPEARDLEDWVLEIARRHPCRLIRVEPLDSKEPTLTASSRALCHLRSGGEGLICVEEIRLRCADSAVNRLPSAVRSLAIGGLPLVLFAPIPATRRHPAFHVASRDADVVIVDSRALDDLTLEESGTARDLAWSRGAPLREAAAWAADVPEIRELAGRGARILYGGDGVPAGAALLGGWLASRLGLEPERDLSFEPARGATEGPVGLVLGGTEGPEARIEMGPHGARVQAPGIDREVALRQRDRADQVIDEIHRHHPDPLYCDALPLSRKIARGLQ